VLLSRALRPQSVRKAQELSIAQLDPALLSRTWLYLALLAWSMAQGMRQSASVLLAPKMWGKHTGNEGAALLRFS
jgi:hypothetical protein